MNAPPKPGDDDKHAPGPEIVSAAGNLAFEFHAFISYSHEGDGAIAKALRDALHSFAKPAFSLRGMRVFMDSASLEPAGDLPGRLREALDRSEFLILLASPASAGSRWVKEEIRYWVETRGVSNILIVHTGGQIAWGTADFDWTITDALNDCLKGTHSREPLWLDLKAIAQEPHFSRSARFRAVVGALASRVLHRSLDDLIGADVDAKRRLRLLRNIAIVSLCVLTIASVTLAVLAEFSRRRAVVASERALERALAVFAFNDIGGVPDRHTVERAAAFALEAHRLAPSPHSWAAASRALEFLPDRLISRDDEIRSAMFSPVGTRFLVASRDGMVTLHDETGIELQRVITDSWVEATAWAPSGTRFAVGSRSGEVVIFDEHAQRLKSLKILLDPQNFADARIKPRNTAVMDIHYISESELVGVGADRLVLIDPSAGSIIATKVFPGVMDAAFCERHVSLGLANGAVELIGVREGRIESVTVHRHQGYAWRVNCARDGSRVASIGEGGDLQIAGERTTKTFTWSGSTSLAYSDDGSHLAAATLEQAGDADGRNVGKNVSRLLDAATGTIIWEHENYVQSDAIAFGKGKFAAADELLAIRSFRLAAPDKVVADPLEEQIEALKFHSNDDSLLVAGTRGHLRNLSLGTGDFQTLARLAGTPYGMEVSQDASAVLVIADASEGGPQGFRREATLSVLKRTAGELRLEDATGMHVSPDDPHLYSIQHREVRSIVVRSDLSTGTHTILARIDGDFDSLVRTADAGILLVKGEAGVAAVDQSGRELWRAPGAKTSTGDPELAAGGTLTPLIMPSGPLSVRRIATGEVIAVKGPEGDRRINKMSPDGKFFAAFDEEYKLALTEQSTAKEIMRVATNDSFSFEFDPNSRWFAVALPDNELSIVDLESPTSTQRRKLTAPMNRDPVPRSDGLFVLLLNVDGVRVLDISGKEPERKLVRALHPNIAMFSADSRLVAIGADDRYGRIVDFASGSLTFESRFSAPVMATAFSADGKWAAFGASDGNVRVIDVVARQVWADIRPGLGGISKLAFPRGDGWIAIEAQRGVVAYRLDPFESLCRKHGRNLTSEEWRQVGGSGDTPVTCNEWRH